MRLKNIKLAGFKSFVDPTSISFPDQMTAVVGPNGCGKSNVIDAVRWVLGESSAKNLRGDAMTDVIFNGSSARKPVSRCSVELVFDNSVGRIQGEYAGYNELSVKRVVARDGQSNYLLNNTKCRRRDVTDLFLGTGLGPRSYAIIEQGMISRLIESKPQELRVFIEEAAGVSKYKERRRETENRIRHTKDNLARLDDVRGELGEQLEKLQRQASAAKRYIDLKKQERTLKAQLTAITWQKHRNKVTELDTQIAQKNSAIDAYKDRQRGEEKDILLYKQRQQDLKQSLARVQQQIFKVGTEITRIEQNQLHAKQRQQQVQQELISIEQDVEEQTAHHQQQQQKIEYLDQQLLSNEPKNQRLQAQIEQTETKLLAAQDNYHQIQKQGREQEQHYNQSKVQAQNCHSQIQSLLTMQMRTQERINDIQDELNELTGDSVSEDIPLLVKEIDVIKTQQIDAEKRLSEAFDHLQESKNTLKQVQIQQHTVQGKLQSINAQIDALEALQQSDLNQDKTLAYLNKNSIQHQPWWQTLQVHSGWEQAFETVTKEWQSAFLVDSVSESHLLHELPSSQWIFAEQYTKQIPSDSLASKLDNDTVPVWLTHIIIIDSYQQGLSKLPELAEHQSVITVDGLWFTRRWMKTANTDDDEGRLKRANVISELLKQRDQQSASLREIAKLVKTSETSCDAAQSKLEQAQEYREEVRRNHAQVRQQREFLTQQQKKNENKHTRLRGDLDKYQKTINQEQNELESLNQQAKELAKQVENSQQSYLKLEQDKQQAEKNVEQLRSQLEDIKAQHHRLALDTQELKIQSQGLKANQQREQRLMTDLQQKRQTLNSEAQQLAMPMDDQAQHLQQLLEQKARLESEQSILQSKINDVEQSLIEAEKGQQGVTDKIQAMLADIQGVKIECEGYKVRAKALLEQLQEMEQSLDELLSSIPASAQEGHWQSELDKVQASLSRLGAVNLAAVSEYDTQFERKQHLDNQNKDLVSALDILEQAIRKIDKETRSRFKDTFDKVNNDLKMLFPKVFGGGAAYLDLTDADLLETGVTIMARPPGKKNSSIHLLSGGEKALTALSLVFAIFRLNPAPFCLLDEVDAPLDDANVGRFCKLVSEMSKSVQFIYITHNKIAMEMASHLTGVTMVEPGVSRMVAVDLDDAVAIAKV